MIGLGAFSSPRDVAQEGERIYAERYKEEYEIRFAGQFAAIDIASGKIFVGQFPEEAIAHAQREQKDALLHLIRIGSTGAFQVSFLSRSHAGVEWSL